MIHILEELDKNNSLKELHLIINDIREPERYGQYPESKYGGYYGQKSSSSLIDKLKFKKN